MEAKNNNKHFVLVHGMCHGAWCWYKLATLLEQAGHRVTAPDLSASGMNHRKIEEVESFADYCQPLLDAIAAIPEEEKVVLVGHSLGGFVIALAMETFPEKVSVAVFVTAVMPSEMLSISKIEEEYLKEHPVEYFMDTSFSMNPETPGPNPITSLGPTYLATKMYQLCPHEDLTLAKMLLRPGSQFSSDQAKKDMLSKQNYGSVNRVFIVCKQDKAIKMEFQKWMVEQSPDTEVKELEEADHMAMFSQPRELFSLLMEISQKH
ncbi:polyneuridine aldehyde esterase-like [Carex rostrata]